jgi:hypothetical protein
MALWVGAMSWSCDELTDGFIPADMPDLIIPGLGDAMASKLVEVKLWERVDGGYRFHDWEQFQPSAEDERERRESVSRIRSEAGKRGAARRWQGHSKSDSKAIANEWQTDSKPMANAMATPWQTDSPDPVPDPIADSLRSSAAVCHRKPADPQPTTSSGESIDVLAEITRGASQGARPGAWDHRGDARTVLAFVRALEGLQRSKEELRTLGQYLASPEAEETLRSKRFTPRSFVFLSTDGSDTSRVERACLLAAEWAVKREAASAPAVAAHRPAVIERPSGPLLTPEEIKQKRREALAKERAERGEGDDDE